MNYNFSYFGKVLMKPYQFAPQGFSGEVMMEEAGEHIQAYLRLKIKMGEQDYPAGPPTTFPVFLEKGEDQKYGVVFDTSDNMTLMIFRVCDDGAFAEYNRTAKPSEQLLQTDFIVSVNGVSNPRACIRQFQKSKVACIVRRSIQLSIILKRADRQKPLGLAFSEESANSIGISIMSITQGAVQEYNDECLREVDKVQVHDRIIDVNGETGTPADIKAKMESSTGEFQIHVLRACPSTALPESECGRRRFWSI